MARARFVILTLAVACLVGGFGRVVHARNQQAVATWMSIGAAPAVPSGAAAVALADGRTLIAGGTASDGVVTDMVVVFDPSRNEITPLGQLLAPRVGHTATLLPDGRVAIIGGSILGAISDIVELFDPTLGTSTLAATLTTPRTGHAAAALQDGSVLIVGGTNIDGAALSSVERFDNESGTVTAMPFAMLQPRQYASATTLIDGRVLVAGGNDGAQDLASAEMFDPSAGSFTPLDPESHLSVPRSRHTALLLPHNNGVLIAGGASNGVAVTAADVFVPTEFPDPYSYGMGHFAATAPMSVARAHAVSGPAGDNGYAFVVGGGSADAEVYRYVTVQTDKNDYAPGERAVITGSGWQPGEAVRLVFQEDPAVHDDYVLQVTADEEGNIYWDQWAPESHDLNVRFYLSASDSRSRAQITFTDGFPASVSLNPTSVTVPSGNTASYQVDVGVNGNNNPCVVTLQVTGGLPTGATATFTNNPRSVTASFSSTLTIATTNTGPTAGRTPPGTYSFSVKAARATGCQTTGNEATTTGTLVVGSGPAASTLLVDPATGTYGGSVTLSATLTAGGAGVSGKSVSFSLNGTPVGNATTIASGVATLSNVSLADINASTYTGGVTAQFAGDASIQSANGSSALTVNKAAAAVTVNGFTGVYDGAAHSATGSAVGVNGENLTSLLDLGATFTDAPGGTADWSFSGNDNYSSSSGTVTITIDKADAAITVSGYTGVYDGDAHGATGTAKGVIDEDLSGLLSLGASFTNVPGGTADWSFAGNTNYNPQSGSVAITISQAAATVNVVGYTGVYDASAHGASGTASGVKGEDLMSLLDFGVAFTNAPGGTANWSFAGDTNYKAQSGSVAIEIAKADATIVVTGYSGTYDGTPHGATGTAAGVSGEDLSSLLDLGQRFSDVPGGTTHWAFAGDGNYNPASGTVDIVLAKAEAKVVVEGFAGVYDGAEHGATGSASGVSNEDLSSLLVLGARFTDVPGGTANWSFVGNGNYNAQSGSVAIEISKADAILTITGYTGVYDGNAHGATGNAAGFNGQDLSALLDLGQSFTDVPGGMATWSFAGTRNYNAASGTIAIVISKANATITVVGYSGVYDGNPHGATGSATGLNGVDFNNLLNLGATFTNAPGGTASWSFAGNGNYNAASGTVPIVIVKANATINVAGYTGIFDGQPHGATGTATGVKDEDLSSLLNLGASFTNVPGGAANWTFAGNTNYNSTSGSVDIAIKPWYLTGFYSPVTMGGPVVVNTVRGGSTVPLKFNLYMSNGGTELTSVTDVASFQAFISSCQPAADEDPLEFTSTGGTSLRYDAVARQFVQNWQTPKGAGACYRVVMTARDGSQITAYFKTK